MKSLSPKPLAPYRVMQCRFCLDEIGEMMAPCRCLGSIQYIHMDCLRRWVVQDGIINEDRIICDLCKTPMFRLETIPERHNIEINIMYNATMAGIMVQYVFMVYNAYQLIRPIDNMKTAQVFTQCLYLWLYIKYFRIKNVYIYLDIMLTRGSYIYIAAYLYFMYFFFHGNYIMMGFAMNLTLTANWHEHIVILTKVNDFLVKN